MKIKPLFPLLIIVFAFLACNTDDFNYAPNVEMLYSPLRLNDSAVLVVKKGNANNLRIDSMRIGDTLEFKIKVYDFKYDFKEVRLTTHTDESTQFIAPDGFTANRKMYKSTKSDEIKLTYIAQKSSKDAYLTIYLQTENTDSLNCCDSLRIATPVKFLP
jgi:hypothetical protein